MLTLQHKCIPLKFTTVPFESMAEILHIEEIDFTGELSSLRQCNDIGRYLKKGNRSESLGNYIILGPVYTIPDYIGA